MIDPLDDQFGWRRFGLVDANGVGNLSSRFLGEVLRKPERDRLTSGNAIADPHKHLDSDAVVDLVARFLAAAAKFDDRLPDDLSVDRRNDAA